MPALRLEGDTVLSGSVNGMTAATTGGELAIYVVVDGLYAGSIVASDPIRENASETIDALRNRGVRDILMLTGDAHTTAVHVAHAVGITAIRSDCLPADKVDLLTILNALRAIGAKESQLHPKGPLTLETHRSNTDHGREPYGSKNL